MVYILIGIVIFEAVVIMNLKEELTRSRQVTSDYKQLMKKWWNDSSSKKDSNHELH